MDPVTAFEAERPRLLGIATRVLSDAAEAHDVVQEAWLRLDRNRSAIESLPAWLTTVTTRLCLDRLRQRVPVPTDDVPLLATGGDPAEEIALADSVGVALHVVLERLSPAERVSFVLHDSFGIDFATIAAVLDTTPAAARKLASRARSRIARPAPDDGLADGEVVDAFMAAARGGDLGRLLALLAPGAVVRADEAAVAAGTPASIEGREAIAAFFDGSATAALPVIVDGRSGFAWYDRGEARVLFDFEIADGRVSAIVFRADPQLLPRVERRDRSHPSRPARQDHDSTTDHHEG